jgi:putative ABC transport system permease protein
MSVLSRCRSWWSGVRPGSAVNRDMEEEFAHHLALRAEHLMREGMTPAEARRRARLEFGSPEAIREHGRSSRGLQAVDEVRGDIRFGLRALMREPGFSAIAVLTVALGIGATAAIFTALDAVLLRPLPFASPERLVVVEDLNLPFRPGDSELPKSRADIRDAQALAAFTHVAAYAPGALNLSGSGAPRRVSIGVVTTDFFATLGVHPAVGRPFTAEEGVPGGPKAAVVSHGFWRRHLGSATDLSAHSVTLNGRRYAVVGVMPRGFAFPEASEIWLPLTIPTTFETAEAFRGYLPSTMIARLAPGVAIEQAQVQVDALHAPWERPDHPRETTLAEQVVPLHTKLVGDREKVLLVLLGATALVLLIACVNVANLLLSRSSARRRELAVRAALGATPGRVLRQLLAESLLLAIIGGVVGLLLAYWGVQLLDALVPKGMLGAVPLEINGRVLGFASLLTVLTGLAFGLLPALGARRTPAGDALKAGSAGAAGLQAPRVRQALVLAQVAVAAMLLVGSALMLRSMHALLNVESGVQPERVATLELTLAVPEYPNAASRRQFFEAVLANLQSLPEVEKAAAVNELPLRGVNSIRFTVHPEGRPPERQELKYMAQDLRITEEYFDVMGIRLLAGRAPRPRPSPEALREVAISRSLAELYWGDESPVGQYLASPGGGRFEIVGVVADVLPTSLLSEPAPQAYYPLLDSPYANAAIVARGRGPTGRLTGLVEQAVREAAPHQAVYNVRTMEQVIAGTLAPRRTNTWLITSFGVLALLLAVIGVYGVIAFSVARRTREIGIRIALGAGAGRVRRQILGEAGKLTVAGLVIGMAGAWLLAGVLNSMVYGVTIRDPLAFAAAPVVLLAAAIAAALVPAQRATRVDPVSAIREE